MLDLLASPLPRWQIQGPADILAWVKETRQTLDVAGQVVATFIIAPLENLWIADRHSEHVVCAQGGPVLSAGEMRFRVDKGEVEVVAVTNQSTGFCPEPASWPAVAAALDKVGLPHPHYFTYAFDFRLCHMCNSKKPCKR